MRIDVSRETMERLKDFSALVKKWNPKVNLVSRASLDHLWERHIEDSLQLTTFNCDPTRWVDLGSGGGFPGIVISAVLKSTNPSAKMTLVESDQRKCAFLRTAIRDLDLNAVVLPARIEDIDSLSATVLSARALAPLSQLLGYASQHLHDDGVALFQKGEKWESEVDAAQKAWSFDIEAAKSVTDSGAAILVIRNIEKL